MNSRIYVLLFAIVSAIVCLMQTASPNSVEGFVPIRYDSQNVVPAPDMEDKRAEASVHHTLSKSGQIRHKTAPELLWGDGQGGVCNDCLELEAQMADQAEIIASRDSKYDNLVEYDDSGNAIKTSGQIRAIREAEAAISQVRAQVAVAAHTFLGRPEAGADYIRGDMRICVKKSDADHAYTSQQLESSQKPSVGYFMGQASEEPVTQGRIAAKARAEAE